MIENKKFPIIIAGSILGIILLVAIFQKESGKELSKAIDAVPTNAAIIFETKNLGEFIESLNNNRGLLNELELSSELKEIGNEIRYISELSESNKKINRFLKGREFVISVHQSHRYENAKLFISPVGKSEYKSISETLKELYSNANILEVNHFGSVPGLNFIFEKVPNYSFHIAYYNDLFLFSFSNILLEKSIRELNPESSVTKNEDFATLSNLTGRSGHRLFIDYRHLPDIMFKHLKNDRLLIDFLRNTGSISAFEVVISENEITLDGYTTAGEANKYLSIFKNQKPQKNNLADKLPSYFSSFLILNLGDGKTFQNEYQKHLTEFNKLKNYRRDLNNWNKENQLSAPIDFYESMGSELALVSFAKNSAQDNIQAIFIEIGDKEKVRDFLLSNTMKHEAKSGQIEAAGRTFLVFPFVSNNFFAISFGTLFETVSPTVACITDEYIIFTDSPDNLQELLSDFLQNSPDKKTHYAQSFNKESNIFIYIDTYSSLPVLKNYLSPEAEESIETDKSFWNKIQGPGIQVIADSDPMYTTLRIKTEQPTFSQYDIEWECVLDSEPKTKPYITRNHNTGENEIFIQTESNTIYLINGSGEVLWRRIIDGEILGEVHQIDYYKNNKLQMLFNTEKSLYLIDRNGNDVADYPLNFQNKATNGVAVFDYDNDKDYRIFYAAENKGVYALEKTGKAVSGWEFENTQRTVTQPVQYFRYDGKDYICFFDAGKLYITNRRGEIRIKPAADFPIAANTKLFFEGKTDTSFPRFVLTDPAGAIYFVYLDGKIKRMRTEERSAEHFFIYENITGDEYPELIFADKQNLKVFDRDGKLVFDYKTEANITHNPGIYRFSSTNIQIGIVTAGANKVYLVRNNGSLEPKFPKTGNSEFSVRMLQGNETFSLITGNKSSKLISYRLN